jgi:hypothetical protein
MPIALIMLSPCIDADAHPHRLVITRSRTRMWRRSANVPRASLVFGAGADFIGLAGVIGGSIRDRAPMAWHRVGSG